MVLVHGFTQTGRSWGEFGRRLGAGHAVNAVDAPGHGGSGRIAAGLWDGASLIGEAGGRATYVGYSMGGRFALHLALLRPDLVTRLVLISASAGIDDASERAERQVADEALANKVEREGVDAFVRWWLSRPMWATLPTEATGMQERLANTASGLASSLRLAGAGTVDPPLWGRLDELAMPTLVVAGELDPAYVGHARRLGSSIPCATVAVVAGAGHACHLERPGPVWEIVEPWLTAHP